MFEADSVASRLEQRSYLALLRRDPRVKAAYDGWIAQATFEAYNRYPHPMDSEQRASYAASRAVELVMSFILENDGEYQAVRQQLDEVLKRSLEMAMYAPVQMIVPIATKEQGNG